MSDKLHKLRPPDGMYGPPFTAHVQRWISCTTAEDKVPVKGECDIGNMVLLTLLLLAPLCVPGAVRCRRDVAEAERASPLISTPQIGLIQNFLSSLETSNCSSMDGRLRKKRTFKIRTKFGNARQWRSRKNRPCDTCRRRKTACIIESSPPCKARPKIDEKTG